MPGTFPIVTGIAASAGRAKGLRYKPTMFGGRIYHTFSIPSEFSANIGGLAGPTNRGDGLVIGIPRNGAFILSPVSPDGIYNNAINSPTGGKNARGAGAVDLQLGQNISETAAMVASGAYSFLAGGYGNTASAKGAANIGGSSNVASTADSITLGGLQNTCSGNYLGFAVGYICTSTSYNTYALGYGGNASRINQFAYGSSIGSGGANVCNQQFSWMGLGGKTTNATPVTLLATRQENAAGTGRLTITSGTTAIVWLEILGQKSDGTQVAKYSRKVTIKNVGGTTALVGSAEVIGADIEDDATCDVEITADDTNDAIQVNVTGPASGTWRWGCIAQWLEFPYGS